MARKRNLVQAVGYLRASSATNVGPDKDSEKPQRAPIERFAKAAGSRKLDNADTEKERSALAKAAEDLTVG